MPITAEEIERRIYIAASRKKPTGARSVGSISRRRGGLLLSSRTLSGARNSILREIGEEIVEEAKKIYVQRGGGLQDARFLPVTGPDRDPRVTGAFPHEYLDSFEITPMPGNARGGIRITNNARVTKSDPHEGRTKTYRYGDVVEWGRGPLVAEKRMFKIGLDRGYAESLLKKKKTRGKYTPLENTTIYNPYTGSFIKYDELLGEYYQWSKEVPEILPSGIIAKAVDNVLGARAGNEVRRRT